MEKYQQTKKFNTGRWTTSEHKKFMKALEKCGRDWEQVQKRVQTRSMLQIRSHAQKIFLNMKNEDIDAFVGFDDSNSEIKGFAVKKTKISTIRKKSKSKNAIQTQNKQIKDSNRSQNAQQDIGKQIQMISNAKLPWNYGSQVLDPNGTSAIQQNQIPKQSNQVAVSPQFFLIPVIKFGDYSFPQRQLLFNFVWNPLILSPYQN